ncbi:MAG: kinase [Deltaproteobacteria bacterium]|jgi:hypothetical protein|nr:kinase [Deltaproteobacteria bacterium]
MARTTALMDCTDGTQAEFVTSDEPKQGGIKDVYFSPDRSYVVAFYRNRPDFSGMERLRKLVEEYRRNIFGMEGGDYFKDLYCWPERLGEHEGRVGIVVPAYDSKFFFPQGSQLDGSEKESKWFTSAKTFNRCLTPEERGTLLSYLQICTSLSRGVKRLHAAGLAHSDLSYKNCLADPATGSACIIDIDGLVVPGLFQPDVVGTPDFIAPEVVATLNLPIGDPAKRIPCRETDQHALAVLIYHYLFHRHPLRGGKVWDPNDEQRQESLEMGEKALFIEHPTDPTNRRPVTPGDKDFLPWVDTAKLPYAIMGPHLSELFLSAFVENLHRPSERPSADDWEDALVKTTDMILPCAAPGCPASWYVFSGSSRAVCPYCGTPHPGPAVPVLEFYTSRDGGNFRPDRHTLTVFHGRPLYPWHATRRIVLSEKLSPDQRNRVGYFIFHNGEWLLVNQSLPAMSDVTQVPPGGRGTDIPPGGFVKLAGGQRLLFDQGEKARLALVTMAKV